MPRIPAALAARLDPQSLRSLERLLEAVEQALRSVYSYNVEDYRESRGDDAQLFGFKVWKHLWYAIEQSVLEDSGVAISRVEGSFEIGVGPLRIGVYGLGHDVSDDIHGCFPDQSPFKRSFGEQNQLVLFSLEALQPVPDAAEYEANSLTIGHFGNPRDGLVKWYLGAWRSDERERRHWSWVERQDEPQEGLVPLPARPQVAPFDQRPRHDIAIRPRRRA